MNCPDTARHSIYCLVTPVIVLLVMLLATGCVSIPSGSTGPAQSLNVTPLPTVPVTASPNQTPGQIPAGTPATETPTPAASPSASSTELYYGNIAIFMDREGYDVLPFDDFGVPFLVPGERYAVRITSDHPIFVYVIRSNQVDLLQTTDGVPKYDPNTRSYDYGSLVPILKMEDVYDSGKEFNVTQGGKYSLVLDTRLSQRDYRIYNEVTKVAVRVLRIN